MTQAKRPSPRKNKSSRAKPEPQSLASAAIRVHDLSGIVCIGLSAELHTIFDKETIRNAIFELESSPFTIIIRSPDAIAYLDLRVVTRDLGDPLSQISQLPDLPTRQPCGKA